MTQSQDADSIQLLTIGVGWVHELEAVCNSAVELMQSQPDKRDMSWARQMALSQVRLKESKNWINIWFDEKEEQ